MFVARRFHPVVWTFGLWFAASVAGQKLWRPARTRSRWDRFHLVIPDWRFFAPDPGVYDHHLLVRGLNDAGEAGPWREITGIEDRQPLHAFWNPGQRGDKAVFDVCAELFRFVERHRGDHIPADELANRVQLSVAYLTLLNYVAGRIEEPGSTEVQFMIAVSGGLDDEDPEVVLVSERHPITQTSGRKGRTTQEKNGESP